MNYQIENEKAIGPDQQLYLDLLRKCLTASIYEESAWKVIEGKPSIAPVGWNPAAPFKNWFRRFMVNQLQKRSLMLVRRDRYDAAVREDGGDWPCFGFTMIGHRGLNSADERCAGGFH